MHKGFLPKDAVKAEIVRNIEVMCGREDDAAEEAMGFLIGEGEHAVPQLLRRYAFTGLGSNPVAHYRLSQTVAKIGVDGSDAVVDEMINWLSRDDQSSKASIALTLMLKDAEPGRRVSIEGKIRGAQDDPGKREAASRALDRSAHGVGKTINSLQTLSGNDLVLAVKDVGMVVNELLHSDHTREAQNAISHATRPLLTVVGEGMDKLGFRPNENTLQVFREWAMFEPEFIADQIIKVGSDYTDYFEPAIRVLKMLSRTIEGFDEAVADRLIFDGNANDVAMNGLAALEKPPVGYLIRNVRDANDLHVFALGGCLSHMGLKGLKPITASYEDMDPKMKSQSLKLLWYFAKRVETGSVNEGQSGELNDIHHELCQFWEAGDSIKSEAFESGITEFREAGERLAELMGKIGKPEGYNPIED